MREWGRLLGYTVSCHPEGKQAPLEKKLKQNMKYKCAHTHIDTHRQQGLEKPQPKQYLPTEISACIRHTGHVQLSFKTFYISCRDLGLSIFFSISQTMNGIIEETVSFYLISWCGYDKTRENKTLSMNLSGCSKKLLSNFLYYSSSPVSCPSRLVWDRD